MACPAAFEVSNCWGVFHLKAYLRPAQRSTERGCPLLRSSLGLAGWLGQPQDLPLLCPAQWKFGYVREAEPAKQCAGDCGRYAAGCEKRRAAGSC